MNWLAPLSALVDVGRPDVPRSHRGRIGPAVTAVKRLVAGGLAPLLRELLAGQSRFNAALAEQTARLPARPGEAARALLAPLAEEVTGGASGRESPALVVLRRAGRPVLARQLAWNRLALELLLEAGEAWPLPTGGLIARCDALAAQADVSGAFEGPGGRAARPFWRELMRRQIAFNHAFVEALRRWMGVARPQVVMPSLAEYEAWWRAREPREHAAASSALAGLTRLPRISLVTPAYETPVPMLRACIESVLAQSYAHWQLCIVDDGSRGGEVERTVREYARRDPRIVFERLPRNGGIARATNAAIALASGELIGFLDHDDTLAPHALAEIVVHLAARPDTDVLYSDEDKIDEQGRRYAPYLKPGLSPDMLRALNCVCHFLVVRAALLREVGGLRPGFEGAQDHDLVLRLLERTSRFVRLPRVLYHWRAHAGSTSHDASAKPAASEAGRRAVEEHLRRLGEAGEVEAVAPGLYRVRYPLRGQPRVSLILQGTQAPSEAGVRKLLARAGYPELELILACDPGTLPSVEALAAGEPRLRLWSPTGLQGSAALRNGAARRATGELLLFLEPGLEPASPGWLEELMSQALRPEVGVVGGHLVRADGCLDSAGLFLGVGGGVAHAFRGLPDPALTAFGDSRWPRNLLAVSGACLMIRRELFAQQGGFDERYVGGADIDLCLRVYQAGRRNLSTPHARFIRHPGASPEPVPEQELARLRERLVECVAGEDPFYEPNLSTLVADGTLRSQATLPGVDCGLLDLPR